MRRILISVCSDGDSVNLVVYIVGTNPQKDNGVFAFPRKNNTVRVCDREAMTPFQFSGQFVNPQSFMIFFIGKKCHLFSCLYLDFLFKFFEVSKECRFVCDDYLSHITEWSLEGYRDHLKVSVPS